ncbi:MAG: tRNA (N6-threonylcarbamoyladenosine(37)-N6)-methyltransferase TrmO [Chloroflexi bacterium]|nr:tRNA (N6-threonylcarbamoyladenosine(37)-N6)-methyltransferase TrmO [Chloroflexota bacterium]
MFSFWKRPQGAPGPPPSPVPVPLEPIGVVRSPLREPGQAPDPIVAAEVIVRDDLAAALVGLEGFGRITVVFWMDRVPEAGRALRQVRPGGHAALPLVGVLATRTHNRPNPIGVTVVELLGVEGARLRVRGLDALDGTPVLDVRPYLPPYDAFPDAAMPSWVWGPTPPHGTAP